jgi:branched-chain amino acid transport system substrate-binding protein
MKKIHAMIALMMVGMVLAAAAGLHAEVFKLALSLAITGPTSDAGNPLSKGVEDYIRHVNDTRLLGDGVVECPIRDDQYQTDITKRNFEDFLSSGIVLYLNYSTGSTLALKRDFEEEKIPVIPASMDAGNLIDSKYIFLPIASYSSQSIGLAEYIVTHNRRGVPRAAMFVHPSAFGRAPTADVQKAVKAGLKIEIAEVIEHGRELDNTAMLQRLMNRKVRYVICQTVQSPVATLLKDAQRLGLAAKTFGEEGKLTFVGAHYTGGNDLIELAGSAAEGFFWATAYTLTSEPGPGTDFQLMLAKKYGRDDKTANSHNYTLGMMMAQVAVEAIRRVKAKGGTVTRESLYTELNAMNGDHAYLPGTTVGPVTYSPTDRAGVDTLQLYSVQDGVFKAVGNPFEPEYVSRIKGIR